MAFLIRWITGGRASHVGILLAENSILHCDIGGVKVVFLETFLEGRKILAIFQPKIPIDRDNAIKLIGSKYDYDGLIGFIPVLLSKRWFGWKIGNPFADKHEFVCSEFVAQALDPHRKIPEFSGDRETLYPSLLLRRMAQGKSFERVKCL